MRSPDVPRRRRVRTTRARVGLLIAAAVVFVLIISLRGIAGFYTDYLWFQELHLTSVWRGILGAKLGLAALFTFLFFVFKLPFLKFMVDWLFASIIIILIITAVAHYLNGGIRVQAVQKVTPQVKAHLSVLLGVLALLKAAGYWLQQYELDFSRRGVVQGASYTDVKAQLPALKLLIVISLFAFALFIYNILRRGWVLPVSAAGLSAFVSVIVGAAYPAFIQQFRVNPTESKKEQPYIERNI